MSENENVNMVLDPLFMASKLFRHRRFEDCVKLCTEVLQKNPYDQVSYGNQDNIRPHPLFCARLLGF